jgi:thiamine-monophosphate kinase
MQELARGLKSVADEYDFEIIGGDTISNTKLDITITVISTSQKPLYRKGVRENCLFAYTGDLGRSSLELKKLFNNGKIHNRSKFVDINLRTKFIQNSSRILKTGMDISDGLFSDLQKMAKLNNIGVSIDKNISKLHGCSGEEYEMLVSFDKRDKKSIIRRAMQSRVKINIFASVKRNKYICRCKSHHF